MSTNPKHTIMLVEDNPDHALLAAEAIEAIHADVTVELVPGGDDALELLLDRALGELPKLILLDVKMAGLSGFDVLERLKGDPRLRSIPVVMLTSSADVGDVQRSYELGSNSYVQKPVGANALYDRVGALPDYWLGVNTPPPLEDE